MGVRDERGIVGANPVFAPGTDTDGNKGEHRVRPYENPLQKLIRNAVAHSLWPVMLGLDYATLELFSAIGPRYDMAQIGVEVFRPSPRQVDLLLVAGVVNRKLAPLIRQLYEAMAEPRFVVAVGAGAISGAPAGCNYAVGGGVDTIVPVDLYIPGDPPRPEQIIAGIRTLTEKIASGEVGR